MRRTSTLTVAAVLCALAFVPAAAADHVSPGFEHWPGGTVQANGGGCAQPCIWLRVWDRTGYVGTTWPTERSAVLQKIREAFPTGMSVQFTVDVGTRFDLERQVPGQPTPCPGPCEQTLHYNEALLESPAGTVFVGRGYRQARGTCQFYLPLGPLLEPYCRATLNHTRACAVGAGFSGQDRKPTFAHEFGHCIGLGHPSLIPCPASWIMCGMGGFSWSAHDRAELARAEMYGHHP